MLTYYDMILRLFISTILGLILGIQREIRHKPAGLRTLALLCVGSTLFTLVSINMFSSDSAARIIAQIITGIGFLGAGTIFRHKDHIEGLTTAACAWAAAAMGIVIGMGDYFLGILGFLFIFVVLSLYPLEILIHKYNRKYK